MSTRLSGSLLGGVAVAAAAPHRLISKLAGGQGASVMASLTSLLQRTLPWTALCCCQRCLHSTDPSLSQVLLPGPVT